MTGQGPLPVADFGPALVFGFGIPGLKGIVLIALVALALYGRPGSRLLAATPYGRALRPWLSLVRMPMPSRSATSVRKGRGRLFWALALTLAAALAALIATRIAVQTGAGMPR